MLDDENNTPPENENPNDQGAIDDMFGDAEHTGADTAAEGDDQEEGAKKNPEEDAPRSRVDDLDAVYDVPIQVSAVLGRAVMPVNHLLKLGRGAIVQLDKRVGEPIEVFVNNKLVARGEVVVVDERLGITMTEIIKSDRQG